MEINSDGKLVITPIHTNPCFFESHETGSEAVLQKDQPEVLEHGDVVALLPDKLAYRVDYSNKDLDNENSDNAVVVRVNICYSRISFYFSS